jgi:hypothetical protein
MHFVALCHVLLHHLYAGLLPWVVSRLSSVVLNVAMVEAAVLLTLVSLYYLTDIDVSGRS